MNASQEEPTQAVSPGADPYELKYPGQSDPLMVNPFEAAEAEFDPVRHQLPDPSQELPDTTET